MTPRVQALAVAALSASLITLQVLLTRIFSVVFMSHLGFAAISIGMLGLSAAGVRIYLLYRDSTSDEVATLVAKHCFLMVPLTLLCVFALSRLGADIFIVNGRLLFSLAAAYAACVGPFYAGGVALSLLLTKCDTRHFGRLYAYDLVGASVGGLVALALLPIFGGPGAVLFTAATVGVVGALVSGPGSVVRKQCLMAIAACVIALVADATMLTFHLHNPKGRSGVFTQQILEKWNAFSRVAVYNRSLRPWSLGPNYHGALPESTMVDIDSSAATSIAKPSDPTQIDVMSYELTALAYYPAKKGHALVIGAGGGRDVMSALQLGQHHVDAVEINSIIVNDVMLGEFANLSENLYRDPRVSVHVQDGRSFVRQADAKYDTIQLSLVDTWAATSAGAFALAENNLYTREALGDYVDHLAPDGVLTFARWSGFEVLRLLVELDEVAQERGIDNLAQHLALVETRGMHSGPVTNLMFRRSPFDATTLEALNKQVERAGFTWLFNPTWTAATHPGTGTSLLLSGDVAAASAALSGASVVASTDDWPFFFLRPAPHLLADMLADPVAALTRPIYLLIWVTFLSVLAAVVAILVPLRRGTKTSSLDRALVVSVAPYFALVGLGFMMTEVCLSQRFVLYLGHPTYALTVVLTALLLGAGFGSWLVTRLPERVVQGPLYLKLLGLGVAFTLLASSSLHAVLFAHTGSASFTARVALSALSILPVAALLGMCLPSAMARLTARNGDLVAWAWGVNGFCSVIGSCLGALCATSFGFSFTAQLGAGLYALSALADQGLTTRAATSIPIERGGHEAPEARPTA